MIRSKQEGSHFYPGDILSTVSQEFLSDSRIPDLRTVIMSGVAPRMGSAQAYQKKGLDFVEDFLWVV